MLYTKRLIIEEKNNVRIENSSIRGLSDGDALYSVVQMILNIIRGLGESLLIASYVQYTTSRLHVFIAHSQHSTTPKDHKLTKLQPPNGFKIRNSDDLHVKILLQFFELIGKHCG